MFQKLQFRPGITRDTTRYTNTGGWYDCDKIRFRNGFPEKMKGWTKLTSSTILGSCRFIKRIRVLSGAIYTAVGTHLRFYMEEGGVPNDITPWTDQDTGLSNPFTTTISSADVAVTKSNHGLAVGDRIDISGASDVGGIVAADLNGERSVSEITDTNNYKFTAGSSASSSTTGGGTVTIQYIMKDGIDQQIGGTGWGSDAWGAGAWGEAGTTVAGSGNLRTWSAESFGEDLVMNAYDNEVFYWDATNGTSTRAFPISQLSGSSGTPQIARLVMVSETDRHVIAFACDPLNSPGVQDRLLIRWSDQENAANWTTAADNTAGGIQLSSGTEIITAVKTRQQILVFTDDTVVSLAYIGGDYTFGATVLAKNTSIKGRNAAVNYLGTVYWMGESGFYSYDGQVREMSCTVEDYIFSRINMEQTEKVLASTNANEAEIIWFYPSSTSDDVDSYVIYNTKEDIWYIGSMDRTCWVDRVQSDNPIAASQDGYLYNHDDGFVDGSTTPSSLISAYIESSPFEIGSGESISYVDRIIPDITFRNSSAPNPTISITISAYNETGVSSHDSNSGNVVKSSSSPIEQFTKNVWVRLRGRAMTIKYADNADASNYSTNWRIGTPRINIREDGQR